MDLRLDGIGHSYDEFEVMRDITLDIPSGQIVCIVGPSGCGKSTLLRFIGGLEKPKRGRILQLGDPPTGCLNPLTYIFQDFALLPWRSVSGNISLVLEDHGIKGAAAKTIIDDVLHFLQQHSTLEEFQIQTHYFHNIPEFILNYKHLLFIRQIECIFSQRCFNRSSNMVVSN